MHKETKDRINKRKIAFVYLMHRMFEGNPSMLIRIMSIPKLTVEDLQSWDEEYRDAVYATIQEEDSKGVKLRDKDTDVPSIKSIKEKILRRIDLLASSNENPDRLATVYKILSEFENADDKKEKGVLDAINESIKPLTIKSKAGLTMLEKMKQENAQVTPGKKRGRPKKNPVEQDPFGVIPEQPEEEELEEDLIEEEIIEETEEEQEE